ncbi:acyltransferase family protein [Bacteroides faecium]|uniref:Acyltransferase n=1 Tax=Bacteroides faecium TaxID=2715212 RepID=A0A6H0KSP4_9BACE|nr:acyltransferase family protein [Bacteroides faecium]QIU95518.1 acyltransferase [Bacteroides faecium]
MIQSFMLISILFVTTIISVYFSKIPSERVKIFNIYLTNAYRGVAILMVVIQHCAGEFGTNLFTPFGGIGVAIFLILSGFGLSESFKKKGINGFVTKKLWRVWLPYFLFYVVVYLLHEKCDYKLFFLNVFSIRQDDYWYVHYMLRCYLVFWGAYRFAYKYRWWILAAFSCYTFFGMGMIRAEQCLSFPLGILLSEKYSVLEHASRGGMMKWALALIVFGIICLAVKQLPEIRAYMGTYLYSAVELGIKLPLGLGVMILLWLLPTPWVMNPFLVLCGILSYELYLVHMQLLGSVQSFVSASMIILISLLLAYSMSVVTKRLQNNILK